MCSHICLNCVSYQCPDGSDRGLCFDRHFLNGGAAHHTSESSVCPHWASRYTAAAPDPLTRPSVLARIARHNVASILKCGLDEYYVHTPIMLATHTALDAIERLVALLPERSTTAPAPATSPEARSVPSQGDERSSEPSGGAGAEPPKSTADRCASCAVWDRCINGKVEVCVDNGRAVLVEVQP